MDTVCQRIARFNDRGGNGSFLHLHYLADQHHQCFTYRDLVREAWAWKLAFSERGLLPGDRVIIILPHGLDVYASFCGALLGGMVPALFAFPSAKLSKADYFKSVNQLVACTDGKLIVTYEALKADLITQTEDCFQGTIISNDEVECDLFAEVGAFHQPCLDDVAFLQFSSGTTGLKKGVAISHRALLTQVDSYANAIKVNSDSDVVVSWLPLYHDMGLITCFMLPLLTGVTLVAMSPFEWVKKPLMLLSLITQYRGTLCWLPNFAYNLLAKLGSEKSIEGIDLSSMRSFINCSEPVLDSSHLQFLAQFKPVGLKEAALSTCYAMAENTFAMTQSEVGEGALAKPLTIDVVDRRALALDNKAVELTAGWTGVSSDKENGRANVSCGRPVANTDVYIVNDQIESIPERCVGQIAIRSPCLFKQYYNNPQATAAAFHGDLFLTGDMGYLAEGELYVIGRSKDTIIVNGKNIYPQDIESLLNDISGAIAGRNVALGVFNESLGSDQLILIIESDEVDRTLVNGIREHAYQIVNSHFEIPVADIRIVARQWLQKSTSGKISRKINRQRYLDEFCSEVSSPVAGPEFGKPNHTSVERSKGTSTGIGTGIGTGTGTSSEADSASLLDNVRACVVEVISANSAYPVENITSAQSLVNSGIIDSLSLASLLAALERRLSVTLPDQFAFVVNEIDSIELITEKLVSLNLSTKTVLPDAKSQVVNLQDPSKQNLEAQDSRVSKWFSNISKSLLESDSDIKYQLLPQLEVSDHLPTFTHPELSRVCKSNFKSESLNTDENGCRVCTDGQRVVSLTEFRNLNRTQKKSLVIGSSSSFGIGVSEDSKIFSNRLNRLSEQRAGELGETEMSWYNFSLRSSLLAHELKTLTLFADNESVNNIVWFSGLNNLSFPLSMIAQKLSEAAAAQGHSGVGYTKENWQAVYDEYVLKPIKDELNKLKDHPAKLLFCLQPVLTWIDKIQTSEEQALVHSFDSCFDLPLRQVISVSFGPIYDRYRADVARLCEANNIQFLDFNQDPFFASDQWLFADRVHLTDLAHEHIAQVIHPMMAA